MRTKQAEYKHPFPLVVGEPFTATWSYSQLFDGGRALDNIVVSRPGKPEVKFETEEEYRKWLSNPRSTSQQS